MYCLSVCAMNHILTVHCTVFMLCDIVLIASKNVREANTNKFPPSDVYLHNFICHTIQYQ